MNLISVADGALVGDSVRETDADEGDVGTKGSADSRTKQSGLASLFDTLRNVASAFCYSLYHALSMLMGGEDYECT